MKFNCGRTWEDEMARLSQWHPFFLLFPRMLGSHNCRWLETVERKGTWHARPYGVHLGFWRWEYRAIIYRPGG